MTETEGTIALVVIVALFATGHWVWGLAACWVVGSIR